MWGAVDIKEQNELFASVHFILNAEYIYIFSNICIACCLFSSKNYIAVNVM